MKVYVLHERLQLKIKKGQLRPTYVCVGGMPMQNFRFAKPEIKPLTSENNRQIKTSNEKHDRKSGAKFHDKNNRIRK